MSMKSEQQYLQQAIEQYEKTGKRFYRDQGVMVLVNEHTIRRFREMTRQDPGK